jgi:predicted CXXCH cytochrome family protein
LLLIGGVLILLGHRSLSGQPPKKRDPAAWGGDHVGQPVPEYVTGDECLFCHRKDVGPTWGKNRHQLTLRAIEADDPALRALQQSPAKEQAAEVKMALGGRNRLRFLKPSEAYGKLELLSVAWQPPHAGKEGKLLDTDRPHWDAKRFGDGCAGCHATGVDSAKRTFSSPSLDCYTCHGIVDLKHSKDTSLVLLAKKRKDPARVVISLCAQCHVRTGQSRSTGLPYPNNFVAGDNLFRDFRVDFSEAVLQALNPGDRHVLENVRDVVLLGKEEVTCLSCHEVHSQATKKHHTLAKTDLCLNCHQATGSMKIRKPYEVHSKTCGY